MPQSKGKKIILFAPTFRGRVARAKTSQAFSIPMFFDALSEDYVLILKHHPHIKKPPAIPEKYRTFAVDFTNVMDIEELLCVADICISDYSSLVFEYSLFEKPMLFFAYDLEEYFDWRGFYYDYDELTPGPVFRTNLEMIDYIQHIDQRFDKQKVINFRKKFMASCDGHSTERILAGVFGTDLEQHTKSGRDFGPSAGAGLCQQTGAGADRLAGKPAGTKEEIRNKLLAVHPQVKGRTLIAYIAWPRKPSGYPPCRPYVDWQLFYEHFRGTYGILYRENPDSVYPLRPPGYYRDMFIRCDDVLTEKEMATAADGIITDYRFDLMPFALEKPFFLYAPDYRWYCLSVKDYEESVRRMKEQGYMKETMGDLISAIGDKQYGLPYEKLPDDYGRICDHFHKAAQTKYGGIL